MNQSADSDLPVVLETLTRHGAAKWMRDPDTKLIFCATQCDLILFVGLSDSADTAIENSDAIEICARNVKRLFVAGCEGWDALVSLLNTAPDDLPGIYVAKKTVFRKFLEALNT